MPGSDPGTTALPSSCSQITAWWPESPEVLNSGYLGYLVQPARSKQQPRWPRLRGVQGTPQGTELVPGWDTRIAALLSSCSHFAAWWLESLEILNLSWVPGSACSVQAAVKMATAAGSACPSFKSIMVMSGCVFFACGSVIWRQSFTLSTFQSMSVTTKWPSLPLWLVALHGCCTEGTFPVSSEEECLFHHNSWSMECMLAERQRCRHFRERSKGAD